MASREFYRELQSLREAAGQSRDPDAIERLSEDVVEMVKHDAKEMKDASVRRVFEATVQDGHQVINDFDPNYRGMSRYTEAADVVSTALFAHTMGQIAYTQVLDAYNMPELIGDSLVSTQQTEFSGEKIPGVSEIGDQVEVIDEGQPYPRAVVGENFVETPETIKRGLIIDVAKETLFFDRTNLILQRASNVGRTIAINREKRILDVVLGISTVYKRNGGAAEATYQSDNTLASTALIDYTDIDAADTKFSDITDPDTGEPIVITANMLICPIALRNTAARILNATQTNSTTGGVETRVNGQSLNNALFNVASNQYVKQRTSSDTTWFYGNPKQAFVYMQNFPITIDQSPQSSYASFERDIVSQFKVSERGAAGVLERRHMLKATA